MDMMMAVILGDACHYMNYHAYDSTSTRRKNAGKVVMHVILTNCDLSFCFTAVCTSLRHCSHIPTCTFALGLVADHCLGAVRPS